MECLSNSTFNNCSPSANKDGGAHVDEILPEEYFFAKGSKLKLNIFGAQTEFERNVVYASIDQIS